MPNPIRIAQLSDTHFLEAGESAEGGGAYNTSEAFEGVRDHIVESPAVDLTVVTGDVADHGRAAQYRLAADAFASLPGQVNVCPGNHDFVAPFTAGIGRRSVSTTRVIEMDGWAFLFIDTSAGIMQPDEHGLLSDPDGGARLHNNGVLGSAEAEWIRQAHDATDAGHVFIWLHHPPAPPFPLSYDAAYEAEWRALVPALPKLRGMGGGHTHVPDEYEFDGCPVFVSPSLKNNFALEAQTFLPPGYRTYEFHDDGSVTSEVHLINDERWPRRPYGRALKSLFAGEITYDDLAEIIARRNRRNDDEHGHPAPQA